MPRIAIKMIADQVGRYGRRALAAGDEFSVKSRQEARLLSALGRAHAAPAEAPRYGTNPSPTYAKPPAPPNPPRLDDKPRRTYKRRDMVVEPAQAPEPAPSAEPDAGARDAAIEEELTTGPLAAALPNAADNGEQ